MPRRKFIDKKNATTYQLVYRAQNDPRIHDPEASDMVFTEVQAPNAYKGSGSEASQNKIQSLGQLDEEYGSKVRNNEGEAANHGIYYDDSKYDYMQHMRDLGTGSGAYFVEASVPKKGGKGKGKISLDEALKGVTLDDAASEGGVSLTSNASQQAVELFGEDMLPSEFVRKTTYQDQQNIPDALAGFQPDMDPRLREVLEALEDDAYVDTDDDIFEQLAEDGIEVDPIEWEETGMDFGEEELYNDDGWETDDTIKPEKELKSSNESPSTKDSESDEPNEDWMAEFNKFKKDTKAAKAPKVTPSDVQSSIISGASSMTGRKKKRKGALTSTSGYSMTSSSLFRTENQTLLDARFDKIEEEYADEGFGDDDESVVSGFSSASKVSTASSAVPQLRSDFDSIMDDFLGNYSMSGKRRVKKGARQSGMEQLEEIRTGLGPARLKTQKT